MTRKAKKTEGLELRPRTSSRLYAEIELSPAESALAQRLHLEPEKLRAAVEEAARAGLSLEKFLTQMGFERTLATPNRTNRRPDAGAK